jgi:aminoglycoside phosphotransferase (APT) family kinase protein
MARTDDEITADLVQDLVRDQHPDLADRPVKLGARGWDNQLWRVGNDLAVRLPWATQRADELLRKVYAWLPTFAPRLPLPIPVPQRLGEPSDRFPRPWIITTWVPGEPADRAPATRAAQAADALAAFLTALHKPAPDGAPSAHGGGLIGRPALWLHGGLHPANVLTADGTFCGVIDFGDLCAGDPACDLAGAWLLLPDGAIDRFHDAYQPALDASALRRARGWAVLRALGGIHIGEAGVRGRPGGKPTWGPPAHAALRRLIATEPHARVGPVGVEG